MIDIIFHLIQRIVFRILLSKFIKMRRLAKKRPLPGKAIKRGSAGCSLRVVKVIV